MTEMERRVNQFDPDQYELARRLALRQQAAVGDLGIISMAAVTAGLTEPATLDLETPAFVEQPAGTTRQRELLGSRITELTTRRSLDIQRAALEYHGRLAA